EAVERAVAADADEPLDAELFQAVHDGVEFFLVVRIDKIARGADERAALGRINFRNFLVERVEEEMRDAGVEEAVEALDQAQDLDLQFARANDGAVNGGVERRRIPAGGENGNALHGR